MVRRIVFESVLSLDERKLAEEAKQRTLNILTDALKKKDHLLVEKPEDLSELSRHLPLIPIISANLVQQLIDELQKVSFKKNISPRNDRTVAYVYSNLSDRVIYLCPLFWKQSEFLDINSRLGTLIHEVAHFLGYDDSVPKSLTDKTGDITLNNETVKLTTYDIELAFGLFMSHRGTYTDGAYSCCGEKSRDSVCEHSLMSYVIRRISDESVLSEDEQKQAEEAKQRTLFILTDALKKKDHLLVEKPEDLSELSRHLPLIPIISANLVQQLIDELQKVSFKKNISPRNDRTVAYVYSSLSDRVIYLCPLFWKQSEFLDINSRPGTLIHEVAHFLGYDDSVPKSLTDKTGNIILNNETVKLTTYNIELAFGLFMSHCGTYTDGAYSCCGEKSRDSVCEHSLMSSMISEDEQKQAEEAKRRTLNILTDALNKKDHLLVEKPEELSELSRHLPIISPNLVQQLIDELQKVSFKKNISLRNDRTVAYVYSNLSDRVIYLCPLFWKQSEFLDINSRPGTLIHEVAHFLGYDDSVPKSLTDKTGNIILNNETVKLTTYDIELAFGLFMSHCGTYTDGAYSCCGEKSRDSVCEHSLMSSMIRLDPLMIFHELMKTLPDSVRAIRSDIEGLHIDK
ncbi:Peptidyl-Lys metalloendopeptidase [Pelobates cultripes]|uniref:Peptidyl-Lys metalloendopeptidase n=1 Tax=Pelobates cultripes TaxID=61616 RepID=A0AAD1SME6_PELCU|nr:Peptidyl-Lys metalloendopeptidase [Pelobates cultripes]